MGVTVIKNSLPIGIITRERLMLYLSGRFGYSLYEKKTVDLIMDINYLSVDKSSNINEVAIRAMDRSMHKIYDFIVVAKKIGKEAMFMEKAERVKAMSLD